MHKILEPKLLAIFRQGYSRQQFTADLIAGVIVGIVALPLAIAFAIASGVKPEQGLYTAVVAGFIIAALGGSRAQISGPTGAFIVIIYGIVQKHGYEGLAVATMIAGVLLIIMGYARMGVLLKFIPYPVTVGFTSGIALIIFSSQTRDFLGLQMEKVPADFVEKWAAYLAHLQPARARRRPARVADYYFLAARDAQDSRLARRHSRSNGAGASFKSARRNDWQRIRQCAEYAARAASAEFELEVDHGNVLAGDHHRAARSD